MRNLRAIGLALLVAGVVATVLGVLNGDIQVGLALFFIPYLQSSTWLGAVAILLIFAGILVLILDAIRSVNDQDVYVGEGTEKGSEVGARTEMGGVVLIGPIPIVFGTSNRAALLALVAAALLVMALVLVLLLWRPY